MNGIDRPRVVLGVRLRCRVLTLAAFAFAVSMSTPKSVRCSASMSATARASGGCTGCCEPILDAADIPKDALRVDDLVVDLLLLRREEHRRVDVRRLRQQLLLAPSAASFSTFASTKSATFIPLEISGIVS